MSKFCKNCGVELKPNTKFCASCGMKLALPSDRTAAPPFYVWDKATATNIMNWPSRKILFSAIAAFLVLAIGIGLLLGSASGGKYPFKNGATAEANVKTSKDTRIGSSAKTGWELVVPDGVMEDGTVITMNILSKDAAQDYQSPDFTLYGTPIEVSGEGAHGVWFAQPVPVTIKIPKEHLKNLAAEELFFATYENNAWHYFMPDNINMKDKTATFAASHFSWLGFGKPSEEEQIKTFARTYAADEYDRAQKKSRFNEAVGGQLNQLFKSMGVDSESARKQLVMDAVSYLESAAYDGLMNENNPVKDFAPVDTLMRLADAAQKGEEGRQEANDKVKELYAKAIAFGVEKHINANKTFYGVKNPQTGYADQASKAIMVLGGLGTAAGAFVEGDMVGGFEAVADMLTGLAGPTSELIVSTLNYVKDVSLNAADEVQAYWTKSEIEEAYRLYTTPGGVFENDFDGIFSLKGNAEALMNIRIIKAHCAKFGIKETDMGEASRNAAIANAWKGLRNYFLQRKISEPQIAKLQQEEEAFIAELKNQGLLSSTYCTDYFGIDKRGTNYSVADRLRRLHAIRNAVLGCIDPNQRGNLDNTRLVRAMNQWIYHSEKKNRGGFFQYLRETGLYEESFTVDPSYAWVLIDVIDYENAEGWAKSDAHQSYAVSYGYARGSYSASTTYEGNDPYDEGLSGTLALKAVFSDVPEIIYPSTPVSLKLSFTATQDDVVKLFFSGSAGADFDQWDVKPGGATRGSIPFQNADGESSFIIRAREGKSYDESLTASLRAGSEGSRISLRLLFYMGNSMGTSYVYEWRQVN